MQIFFQLIARKKKNLLFHQSESLDSMVSIPDIKLHSNPSAFNVYCNVRHCVLEWQKKETSMALASKNTVQSGDSDSDEEEEAKEPPVKLPKVRGLRQVRGVLVLENVLQDRSPKRFWLRGTSCFLFLDNRSWIM